MIRRLFSSQFRINMVSGVVATVVNILVMAVAFPIYLHFLGYEKYGVWLVLTTVLTFAQLGDIGISQAIMKLVAEDYGRNDIRGIQHYITTALAMLCISGTVALVVILLLKTQIVALFRLSDENARMVLWLLPYIGILSIYVFIVHALNAVLSGLGRMDLANYIQSVSKVVGVVAAAILLYIGRGIESLLIASTLSYIFIQVASFIYIRRIANIHFLQTANLDVQRGKHILSFGGAVFGGSLINMFLSPFNKLMLSRYAGVSAIPVYEIAFKGSMQVRNLIAASLSALMPEVSRIGASMTEYSRNRITSIYRRAMKLIFLLGVPLYVGLIIAAPLLLRVWLGDRFVETLPPAFRIMLIATFFSLLFVPTYYTLLGLGWVRQCFYAYVIQAGTNAFIVVAIVVLGSTLSVIHVVCAVLAGMSITSIYLTSQKYRILRTDGQYRKNDGNISV